MKMLQQCYSCGSLAEAMQRCSRCKLATYCSTECQYAHWKAHKPSCAQIIEDKSQINTNQKREFRLFSQWANEAMPALAVYCKYSTPEFDIENFNRISQVFRVRVDFDYNIRSFRPIAPAEIGTKRSGQRCAVFGAKAGDKQENIFSCIIQYKEHEFEVPVTFSFQSDIKSGTDGRPVNIEEFSKDERTYFLFQSIELKSAIFSQWGGLEINIDHFRCNDTFLQFLIHAFHLPSKKPRYKGHIIILRASLGMGLGQVMGLTEYRVCSVAETEHRIRHILGQVTLEHFRQTNVLDADGGLPRGMKAGEEFIDDLFVPLVITPRYLGHLCNVHLVNIPPQAINKNFLPPHKCDRVAAKMFEQLKQLPAPQVDSPDLNA